jgi:hypothetical protein
VKWAAGKIHSYVENKQFIDTAVIPAYRILFRDDKETEANRIDAFLKRISQLEERLTGRLILFPPFVCYGNDNTPLTALVHEADGIFAELNHVILIPADQEMEQILLQILGMNGSSPRVRILSVSDTWEGLYQQMIKIWMSR